LARQARERGIDVQVVAAGKVPRASGDRVKTDKRDAERLCRLLAAGELRFAFVPTVADEQFRDVIRAIEDVRGDLMRARRDIRWSGPARRSALLAALEQAIPDSTHAQTIAALRCFRGIDTLTAAGLCAEIGDWHRFRPKQLSGFLGIVPSEHTSDSRRRQGRSPSPGRSTPADCWSKPRTTTATNRPSVTASRGANTARTRG
jgi:transposase